MSLVLTRRDGEGLTFVGPDGEVIHIGVEIIQQPGREPKAHLVIDAPPDVLIARDELLGRNEKRPPLSG